MNAGPSATRRQFLVSMAAASCASVAAGTASAGASRKVVVGAHPWVYAATQPKYGITPVLDRIFADMAYAGMEGVELMHSALRPDNAVSRIAALSREHRLPVIGMSFGGAFWDREQHQAVLDDARLTIPRLAKLGGRTLGVSVGQAKGKKTPEQFDAQAELLRKVTAICQGHGVTLNLHNHTYEVEHDLHDLKGTLARLPGIKLGPDLNWLVRGGVDPVRFLRQYRDQIVFLHLRDQKSDGAWSEALGEGNMDYRAIAAVLREIDFAGDAVIELAHPAGFKPTRPLRESLKISRHFVRATLGY